MAQQTINVGAAPNDGTGTPLRTAFQYTNSNFSELYTAVGPSGNNIVVPGSATITGDLTVDTSTLKVDSTNNRVGILTATPRVSLDVASGNGYVSGQFDFGGTGPGANAQGFLSYSGGNAIVGSYGNTSLLFYTNGAEQMRLNSTGLGVGRSPISKLNVDKASQTPGGTTPNGAFVITDTVGSNLALEFGVNSASLPWIQSRNSTINSYYDLLLNPNGGNVGIGVTPSAWSSSYKALQFGQSASVSGFSSELAVFGSNCYFDTTDSRWERNTYGFTSQYYQTGGTHVWRIGGTAGANTDCAFTQAMTLDASGNLLVNTTSQVLSAKVSLQTAGTRGYSYNDSTGGAGTKAIIFGSLGVEVGSVSTTTASTTYNTLSDYRLKEAVQPLVGGLARVSALKPSIYKWKSNGSSGEGFLAHELAEVVPAAVTGEKDAVNEDGTVNPQGVDMSRIVPILVAAIQELAAEVNALKKA